MQERTANVVCVSAPFAMLRGLTTEYFLRRFAPPEKPLRSEPDALRLSPTQHQGNELPRLWAGR